MMGLFNQLTRLLAVLAMMALLAVFGFDVTDSDKTMTIPVQASREFMLSFDDGPLPGATERVLDALAELKASDGKPVRAGFFLVGDAPDSFWLRRDYYALYEIWPNKGSIVKYPRIAQRIQQAGHVIGCHTAHHAWFRWPWLSSDAAIENEFSEWEAMARPILGKPPTSVFRPPYLVDSELVRDISQRLGYQIIMGETIGDTLPGASVEKIEERALGILQSWKQPYPCVLIFHDILPITYQHIGTIVRYLQQQGFHLVHFDPRRLQNEKKSNLFFNKIQVNALGDK